ncbi:Pseudaminic acid synthase [Methylobacterium crusticola]|uniref:Pseudaminic acid synthase n=1 Tax=Methylobacterium crusticola TaxID=1697972 RepID=A0ABQ4R2N6_9HYPH|nr:pseudaminic acid synthase [Methylobacterium crusticola]GJD51931.1 Pseudaminic acid synthase [Methylobacterium crusticola]
MAPTLTFAGRPIGPEHPPFVIAELSGNHNGDIGRALALIDAAAATGADAIKIQTYTPDTITLKSDRPEYRIADGPWAGRTLHDLYAEAHTPYAWHERLFARAAEHGVPLFSSPFDDTAVELLSGLGCPAYKIASFEIVDLPLIARAAREGKPLIISTGMANLGEIAQAVDTAHRHGAGGVALLHCISAYPAPIQDANVRTVPHLGQAFGVVSGLSDHMPGTAASVAAVVLGGAIVEKHMTLARSDGGPDAAFSLEPDEFAALVRDCKAAWAALGRVGYEVLGSEAGNLAFRRSLVAVRPIPEGAVLTAASVRSIRPGHGLAPKYLPAVLGRRAARAIAAGEPLAWDMLA